MGARTRRGGSKEEAGERSAIDLCAGAWNFVLCRKHFVLNTKHKVSSTKIQTVVSYSQLCETLCPRRLAVDVFYTKFTTESQRNAEIAQRSFQIRTPPIQTHACNCPTLHLFSVRAPVTVLFATDLLQKRYGYVPHNCWSTGVDGLLSSRVCT